MKIATMFLPVMLISTAFCTLPAKAETQESKETPAMLAAVRIGVYLGLAQRCGMKASDTEALSKLGKTEVSLKSKDQSDLANASSLLLDAQHYGLMEAPQKPGACLAALTTAAGILGNLSYSVGKADLSVPDMKRATPMDNLAAWSGKLAVNASNCGLHAQSVNRATTLAYDYIAASIEDNLAQSKVHATLALTMLEAAFEKPQNEAQCVDTLVAFGALFGDLDLRLQNIQSQLSKTASQ